MAVVVVVVRVNVELAGVGDGGGGCEFSSYACLYSLNPTSIRE